MKSSHLSIGLLVFMVLGLLLFVGLPTGYMQDNAIMGTESETASGVGYPIVIDPSDSSLTPATSLYSNGTNWGFGTLSPLERLTLAANSNIAVQMSTPVNVIVTPESGGALSAGSYYFKVVASDSVGLTTGSAEVVCAVDGITTNRCALQWDAMPGADFYRVYKGSASGGQDRYKAAATNSYNYNTDVGASFGTVPQVTSAYVVKLQASGNSWLLGQMGIGTTNPRGNLDVVSAMSHGLLYVVNDNGIVDDNLGGVLYLGKVGAVPNSNSFIGSLFFEAKTTDSLTHVSGIESNVIDGATTRNSMTGDLRFLTKPAGVDDPLARMVIDKEGNVGIGTTNPVERLDVVGNIHATGDICDGSGCLSELSQQIEALQNQIDTLQAQNNEQDAGLEALEQAQYVELFNGDIPDGDSVYVTLPEGFLSGLVVLNSWWLGYENSKTYHVHLVESNNQPPKVQMISELWYGFDDLNRSQVTIIPGNVARELEIRRVGGWDNIAGPVKVYIKYFP